MIKVYDVVIIGGGITGLSTAYNLSKNMKRCLLVERGDIGDGASSSCDDMIMLQSKKAGPVLELALESNEMYKSLSKELNFDVGYENRGGMVLIEDDVQLSIMETFVSNQKKSGLNVEIVDRKFIDKFHPHVNRDIKASTYSPTDAQVSPFKVMKGFMNGGIRFGLDIRKRTIIKNAVEKNGYWEIEFLDGEKVQAENVVIAAGAWSEEVGLLFDTKIPIGPKKGQIIITEQIPKLGSPNIWGSSYIVSKLHRGAIKRENPRLDELGIGFSFTQTDDGNYMIGSTREFCGFNKETDYEVIEILLNQAKWFFPILENVNIIRTFAGFRPYTPDGKPIIGEVTGKNGLYIAAGHEGDGIALAPVTGRIVSDLITGKEAHEKFEHLSLSRF